MKNPKGEKTTESEIPLCQWRLQRYSLDLGELGPPSSWKGSSIYPSHVK